MCFSSPSPVQAPAVRPAKTEEQIRAEQKTADDVAREKQRSRLRALPGRSQTFGPGGSAGALIGQLDTGTGQL